MKQGPIPLKGLSTDEQTLTSSYNMPNKSDPSSHIFLYFYANFLMLLCSNH